MSVVVSVNKSSAHTFSKQPVPSITLIAGEGVEGDAYRGISVQHRSRVQADPSQPNLRQVHLIHRELIEELQLQGFNVEPASMGENITTRGLDLLSLPRGTLLNIGPNAILDVTGLRNPCRQLDQFQPGLMAAVFDRDSNGHLIRKAGIMSVVIQGDTVRPGDAIAVVFPQPPHKKLDRV